VGACALCNSHFQHHRCVVLHRCLAPLPMTAETQCSTGAQSTSQCESPPTMIPLCHSPRGSPGDPKVRAFDASQIWFAWRGRWPESPGHGRKPALLPGPPWTLCPITSHPCAHLGKSPLRGSKGRCPAWPPSSPNRPPFKCCLCCTAHTLCQLQGKAPLPTPLPPPLPPALSSPFLSNPPILRPWSLSGRGENR